jgi:hypothetical protein
MDVWCVYVFILCLCCPLFRSRPCDELITRSMSPTVCKVIMKLKKQRPGPKGALEPVGEKNNRKMKVPVFKFHQTHQMSQITQKLIWSRWHGAKPAPKIKMSSQKCVCHSEFRPSQCTCSGALTFGRMEMSQVGSGRVGSGRVGSGKFLLGNASTVIYGSGFRRPQDRLTTLNGRT